MIVANVEARRNNGDERVNMPLAASYAAAAQGVSVAGERAGKPMLRALISEGPAAKRKVDDDEPVAEVRGIKKRVEKSVKTEQPREVPVHATLAKMLATWRPSLQSVGRPIFQHSTSGKQIRRTD
jgi:hypothetical protein